MKMASLIKMCLNETYSRARIGKHLFAMFPIKNGLKQGDALSALLFKFALDYVISLVHFNQGGLKLNYILQLLVYADEVNRTYYEEKCRNFSSC
jgi:hypothetical protein